MLHDESDELRIWSSVVLVPLLRLCLYLPLLLSNETIFRLFPLFCWPMSFVIAVCWSTFMKFPGKLWVFGCIHSALLGNISFKLNCDGWLVLKRNGNTGNDGLLEDFSCCCCCAKSNCCCCNIHCCIKYFPGSTVGSVQYAKNKSFIN